MEKYSKAVSEMYLQFKKREAHPLEKYIGRLACCYGEKVEVVGYSATFDGVWALIVDGTKIDGWCREMLAPGDVVFKECESYWYANISDLIE